MTLKEMGRRRRLERDETHAPLWRVRLRLAELRGKPDEEEIQELQMEEIRARAASGRRRRSDRMSEVSAPRNSHHRRRKRVGITGGWVPTDG